jgi:aldose 1-epimerase
MNRYSAVTEGTVTTLVDRGTGNGDGATVVIDAAQGNNVLRFSRTIAGRAIEVLVPPGPEGLRGYRAGNPILFPFPNRIRGGRFTFGGHEVQLPINEVARGNRIHGLVFDKAFTPTPRDEGREPDGAVHGAYLRGGGPGDEWPWATSLVVITRLVQGVLDQRFLVHNHGPEPLPFGLGTHPWFPDRLDGQRGDTVVWCPGRARWVLDEGVPTGEIEAVEGGRFDLRSGRALGGQAYDDLWTDLHRRPNGWSEAHIEYGERTLSVMASPEFREWVVFAPTNRPVICLEPYTCATDAPNLHARGLDSGMIVLEPGGSWEARILIGLSAKGGEIEARGRSG